MKRKINADSLYPVSGITLPEEALQIPPHKSHITVNSDSPKITTARPQDLKLK